MRREQKKNSTKKNRIPIGGIYIYAEKIRFKLIKIQIKNPFFNTYNYSSEIPSYQPK